MGFFWKNPLPLDADFLQMGCLPTGFPAVFDLSRWLWLAWKPSWMTRTRWPRLRRDFGEILDPRSWRFPDQDIKKMVVSDVFYFHPCLGKWSNLTNIFQRGWNHQLVSVLSLNLTCWHTVGGSEFLQHLIVEIPYYLRRVKQHHPNAGEGMGFLNHQQWHLKHGMIGIRIVSFWDQAHFQVQNLPVSFSFVWKGGAQKLIQTTFDLLKSWCSSWVKCLDLSWWPA